MKWFRDVPDGVWIGAILAQTAAAIWVGYALMKAAGY